MARDDNNNAAVRDIRIGKDILELVSSAMYVDPLTGYREYIQNAADSIDEARAAGVIAPDETGRVEITLDQGTRTIRIRDNGAGISRSEVEARLLSLGGSAKRGTSARGFRGVGRLAALGYAQELTFRTRSRPNEPVTKVTWDGRRLKSALAGADGGDLISLVADVVDVSTTAGDGWPDHFFEVEIARVARQRGDRLLDPAAVEAYLRQVAPVPFNVEFSYAERINEALRAVGQSGTLEITIDGGSPLTRPHLDAVCMGGSASAVEDLVVLELPAADGGLAAIAWFAHHGYHGAIPSSALVKGVRVRVGNLQIGDASILEGIFPEQRFNSWTMGEVHVLDTRIVPNGRRDEFEANAHHANLVNQLSPIGRDIARRCRTSSNRRSKLREFQLTSAEINERLAILAQGSLGDAAHAVEVGRAAHAIARLRKIADADVIDQTNRSEILSAAVTAEERLSQLSEADVVDPLASLAAERRAIFSEAFELIYECSISRAAAKALVDRMIAKLAA